jgi:hypothetical protein
VDGVDREGEGKGLLVAVDEGEDGGKSAKLHGGDGKDYSDSEETFCRRDILIDLVPPAVFYFLQFGRDHGD